MHFVALGDEFQCMSKSAMKNKQKVVATKFFCYTLGIAGYIIPSFFFFFFLSFFSFFAEDSFSVLSFFFFFSLLPIFVVCLTLNQVTLVTEHIFNLYLLVITKESKYGKSIFQHFLIFKCRHSNSIRIAFIHHFLVGNENPAIDTQN